MMGSKPLVGIVLALSLATAAMSFAAPKPAPTPARPPARPTPTPGKSAPPPRPTPTPAPAPSGSGESDGSNGVVDLEDLLQKVGERARAYETVALKFVCIESIRSTDDPRSEKHYDYMYVQEEAQRYRPYRQVHTGKIGKGAEAETSVELDFPDAYSWTLMFAADRQGMFRFHYVGDEWFSLRHAYILGFTAPLPFTSGRTVYEWSGKAWIDSENQNILKVEAEPGNQSDRLKEELKGYRQAPRFLIYPMGHRPRGMRYNITFLNELHDLSLPDQVDVRTFSLDLQGTEEWDTQTILRYSGYRFFGVDVRDLYQVKTTP